MALVFPYLRAFITTLTSVANLNPLILPTYNLSNLGTQLKERTTIEQ
ncbi:protein-export chaperone SecB [Chitinophaga oryzae]|uniref:Protein-export chaperone SecB n=1 Tax=Chitinophaga oryzae TaxID=2725414 RepID=A0ABX6LS40_9BACT|nr:protein-export chaperone SecB [Chitinophaga oryzae]